MKSTAPTDDALGMYGGQSTYAASGDSHATSLATYFLNAVHAYQNSYVGVYAITPQNEPEYAPTLSWNGK